MRSVEQRERVGFPARVRADRLDRVEAEVAGEDAEAHEQRAGLGIQQAHAPLDRRLDGALPVGEVARRGDQQGQPLVEPGEHHAG